MLGKARKQRRGLETQPVFGEPSRETMSVLKDVKDWAHNSRKLVSTLSKELPTCSYLAQNADVHAAGHKSSLDVGG